MHRAKKIEPKEILTPHIEFNSEKRKNTRNDFEKDMFKILNNALKFMVVIDNLRNVRAKQEDSKTKKVNKMITVKYLKLMKLYTGHLTVFGVKFTRYIVSILQK